MLPRWFGKISPRFATPANSIAAVGAIGLALALSGTFETLAVISTLSRLFTYIACIAAVPKLDYRDGNIRWGRGVLLPLAAGALCIWAASQSKLEEWWAFVAFLLIGSFLFLVARLGRQVA